MSRSSISVSVVSFVIATLLCVENALAQQVQTQPAPRQSIIRYDAIHHPEFGKTGMGVSQREVASQV